MRHSNTSGTPTVHPTQVQSGTSTIWNIITWTDPRTSIAFGRTSLRRTTPQTDQHTIYDCSLQPLDQFWHGGETTGHTGHTDQTALLGVRVCVSASIETPSALHRALSSTTSGSSEHYIRLIDAGYRGADSQHHRIIGLLSLTLLHLQLEVIYSALQNALHHRQH